MAPWWEAPGPDLIAELIPHLKAEQHWHFQLDLSPLHDDDFLIGMEKEKGWIIDPKQKM